MTREERWIRAELETVEGAIRAERRRFPCDVPVSEKQRRHSRRRRDVLKRILRIVREVQR